MEVDFADSSCDQCTGEMNLDSSCRAINFNFISQVGTFSTTNIYGVDNVVDTITQSNPPLKLRKSITMKNDLFGNPVTNSDEVAGINSNNLTNRSKNSNMQTPRVKNSLQSTSNLLENLDKEDRPSMGNTPKNTGPDLKKLPNKSMTKQASLVNIKEPSKLRKSVLVSSSRKDSDKDKDKGPQRNDSKIPKINYVVAKKNTADAKRHTVYTRMNRTNKLDETKESFLSEYSISEAKIELESQLINRHDDSSLFRKHEETKLFEDNTKVSTHCKNTSSIVSKDSLQTSSIISGNDYTKIQANPKTLKRLKDKVFKNSLHLDYNESSMNNSLNILMSKPFLNPLQRLKLILGCSTKPKRLIQLLKSQLIKEIEVTLKDLKINYGASLIESKADMNLEFKMSSTTNQALMFIKEKSETELLESSTTMEPSSLILRFFALFIIIVFEIDPLKIVRIDKSDGSEFYMHNDYVFDASKDITTLQFEGFEMDVDSTIDSSNRELCPMNTVQLFYMLQEAKFNTKSVSKFKRFNSKYLGSFLQTYTPEVTKWKYETILDLKDSKEIEKVLNSTELIKCNKTVSFLSFAVKDIIKYISLTNSQKVPIYYLRDLNKQLTSLEQRIIRLSQGTEFSNSK